MVKTPLFLEGGGPLTPLLFLECQFYEILHNKQIQITYKLKLCYKLKKITSDSGFGERLHEKILQIEHFASDRTEISLQIANYFNSYSGFRFKSRLTPLYLAGHFNQIFKLNYSERKIRFKSLEKVASHIKINFALKEF